MGALIKKVRPEDAIKPENFYIRFDEAWKVTGKCDRTEGYELSVVNWGKQASLFFQVPLHLWEYRCSSSPGIRTPLTRRPNALL